MYIYIYIYIHILFRSNFNTRMELTPVGLPVTKNKTRGGAPVGSIHPSIIRQLGQHNPTPAATRRTVRIFPKLSM